MILRHVTSQPVNPGIDLPDADDLAPGSPLSRVIARGRVRSAMLILGPAFVASVAYVDPGNFATNFAGGAKFGYRLVWVIVMASLMGVLVQYLTSKIGLFTGRSLPEVCREHYGRKVNTMLWLQAEVIAMATDLAEFVGAAVGLHLLFGIAFFPAGLITAVVAFGILMLEERGYRKFELAIIAFLAIIGLGALYLFFTAGTQDYNAMARGMIPNLSMSGSAALAVAIVGATVMPHVVYLHSALQQNRIRPENKHEMQVLLRFNRWDCLIGLGIAGAVNLSMLCIAAALFNVHGTAISEDLVQIHSGLATLVGGGAALAFAVALMASGFSSSSVGTYAGQIVMSGFMGWHIPLALRRLITMAPALVVLAIGVNTTDALVISQIVLSFGIPFALVPLVLITRNKAIMGELVNRPITTVAITGVTVIVSALNVYLVYDIVAGFFS